MAPSWDWTRLLFVFGLRLSFRGASHFSRSFRWWIYLWRWVVWATTPTKTPSRNIFWRSVRGNPRSAWRQRSWRDSCRSTGKCRWDWFFELFLVYWNKKRACWLMMMWKLFLGGFVIYLDWSTLNMRTCSVSTSKHAEIVGKWWLMSDEICVTLAVYWE